MVRVHELTEVLVVPHLEFGLASFNVLLDPRDDTVDLKRLIREAIGIAHEDYVLTSKGRLLGPEDEPFDAGVYMLPHHLYLQEDPLRKNKRHDRNTHERTKIQHTHARITDKTRNTFLVAPGAGV